MLARLSAMVQDVFVVTSGVLKGITKDRHSVKGFLFVDASGERMDCGREPRLVEGDGAEWVAEDVTQQIGQVGIICNDKKLQFLKCLFISVRVVAKTIPGFTLSCVNQHHVYVIILFGGVGYQIGLLTVPISSHPQVMTPDCDSAATLVVSRSPCLPHVPNGAGLQAHELMPNCQRTVRLAQLPAAKGPGLRCPSCGGSRRRRTAVASGHSPCPPGTSSALGLVAASHSCSVMALLPRRPPQGYFLQGHM